MNKDQFTLTLSIEELNLILTALGQRPYLEVYMLIGAIQQQVSLQQHAQPVLAPEPSPPGPVKVVK